MVRLLETDHLNDQLAALAWLRTQSFVSRDSIDVAGNSFGGIEVVLGAERGSYCAAYTNGIFGDCSKSHRVERNGQFSRFGNEVVLQSGGKKEGRTLVGSARNVLDV